MSSNLQELLDFALGLAQAAGGAVWAVDRHDRTTVVAQSGLGQTRLDQLHANWPQHTEWLSQVAASGRSASLTARVDPPWGTERSGEVRLVLVQIPMDGGTAGVVELFLPSENTTSAKTIENIVRRTWERIPALDSRGRQEEAGFVRWLAEIHADLDLERTCFRLANETQAWSHWDRVSVAVRRGSALRIQAIGGLETFDRRAGAVRELERLLAGLGPDRRTLSGATGSDGTPEQQASDSPELSGYITRVQARAVIVIPLCRPDAGKRQRPIGALVLEQFAHSEDAKTREEIDRLVPFAPWPLIHALDHQRASSPLLIRCGRRLVGRPGLIAALILTSLLLTGLALTQWQTDLVIAAPGTLRPRLQRDLFANSQGIIEEVLVRNADVVKQGDPLIRLRSPELEYERIRLNGELATVRQQIGDLETLRGDPRRTSNNTTTVEELAARSEELKAVQSSLEQQVKGLERRNAQLTLISPIDGQVLTWDIDHLLSGRPVERTDRLVTIADISGPWIVEAMIDPRDIGPVVESMTVGKAGMTLTAPQTPETLLQADNLEMAPSLQVHPTHGLSLILTANVVPTAGTRPGTLVNCRIDCGRAAVGKVWFRRLIDRLSVWWTLL